MMRCYYNKPRAPTALEQYSLSPVQEMLFDLKPSLCASCRRGLAVATLLTKLYYVPLTSCSSGVGQSHSTAASVPVRDNNWYGSLMEY